MHTAIVGHHHHVSDATREHIQSGAAKLERFYSPIIDCQVTVTRENERYQVDVVVNVHGNTLKSSDGGEENLFQVVDGALEKMERQLKKLHDKRRRHRGTTPEVAVPTEPGE